MSDRILQRVPLGQMWPTIDPFLFCVHHDDDYPQGTSELTPPDSLAGRAVGSDFSGRDGWSMYHGTKVPGFPQHPHRGFETISYMRRGFMDHSDSLGATARFGRGDVQWMTAGKGIQHCEMFPLLDRHGRNPMELFQIWINLPAEDKMVDPHFAMLWDHDIPTLVRDGTRVTVVAGPLDGLEPASPPPHSWASRDEGDVAIWNLHLETDATFTLPPARLEETVRTLYVYEGAVTIDGELVEKDTAVVVTCDIDLDITAIPTPGMSQPNALSSVADVRGGDDSRNPIAEVLMLQGRPIGEPVAQQGPFVMNTQGELRQAFLDYRETGFGGWPWTRPDPDHGPEFRRFARHADGTLEEFVVAR